MVAVQEELLILRIIVQYLIRKVVRATPLQLKLHLDLEGSILTVKEEPSEGRLVVTTITGKRERLIKALRERAEELDLHPVSLIGRERQLTEADEALSWRLLETFDASSPEMSQLITQAFSSIFNAIHIELFHNIGTHRSSGDMRLFLDATEESLLPWFWKDTVRWIEPVIIHP